MIIPILYYNIVLRRIINAFLAYLWLKTKHNPIRMAIYSFRIDLYSLTHPLAMLCPSLRLSLAKPVTVILILPL